jgi:hypothetical protein
MKVLDLDWLGLGCCCYCWVLDSIDGLDSDCYCCCTSDGREMAAAAVGLDGYG